MRGAWLSAELLDQLQQELLTCRGLSCELLLILQSTALVCSEAWVELAFCKTLAFSAPTTFPEIRGLRGFEA